MAKSTRSKWKRMHRRQRAQEVAGSVTGRVSKLHKKLRLTVKGGISAVPSQDPETRFHFLNPELDPRVPNTRKDLNNNYRLELNHVAYDYTKPLRLAKPKTNLHGKSDPDAPHPMTVSFETIDADAPVAGHAMTKADLERYVQRSMAQEAAAAANRGTTSGCEEDEGGEDDDDAPEEYVFAMEDAAPRKVVKKAAKKDTAASAASKIKSMSGGMQKDNKIVAVSGSSKMKTIGNARGAAASESRRVVSSGSKAAKNKTGAKK